MSRKLIVTSPAPPGDSDDPAGSSTHADPPRPPSPAPADRRPPVRPTAPAGDGRCHPHDAHHQPPRMRASHRPSGLPAVTPELSAPDAAGANRRRSTPTHTIQPLRKRCPMLPPVASHPTALALLEHARANPDDQLPRLALADFLEEHGEPLVADDLRRSLREERWILFPEEECDRWAPFHGCLNGWFGVVLGSRDALPDSPWLGALAGITIDGSHLAARLRSLFRAASSERLFAISLDGVYWYADTASDAVRGIAGSPNLRNLRSLDLILNCTDSLF